jgi:hypothetical protein
LKYQQSLNLPFRNYMTNAFKRKFSKHSQINEKNDRRAEEGDEAF